MLRKIENYTWLAALVLTAIFALGFFVTAIGGVTIHLMLPVAACWVGAYLLNRVNRIRSLAQSAREGLKQL